MKWFSKLVGDTLLISMGALSLHVFILLNLYGGVTMIEDVDWILYTETGLAVLIILLGLYRLLEDLRHK